VNILDVPPPGTEDDEPDASSGAVCKRNGLVYIIDTILIPITTGRRRRKEKIFRHSKRFVFNKREPVLTNW